MRSPLALPMVCFSVVVTCFFGSLSRLSAAEAAKPNIIVILADDLGYGDLGCFGQKTLKTPRLDEMAAQGMRFTQFYAGSTVCAPSRCVLMTGKHTGRAVVRGNSYSHIVIKPDEPTLGSLLKKAGYTTACIGKWGMGTPAPDDALSHPNACGFDHFFGFVHTSQAHNFYPPFLVRNGKVEILQNELAAEWRKNDDPKVPSGGVGVSSRREQYAPQLFMDDALRFIREHRAGPFFLYLALNTPHANNEGRDKGMEVTDLGEFKDKDWPEPEKGFAAMIRDLDRDTGRVLDLLRELKIEKDTLVIFSSDNGPHSEGGHKADFFDSNGKFRGIKRDLTEGGIRVPMIAWRPGSVPAGGENDRQWWLGDLMATAAELAGVERPAGIDSDSMAAALRGEVEKDQWKRTSPLYWEFYERGSAQALRFGKWKAIRAPMHSGPIELYDLSHDFEEKRSYSDRRPDLVKHAANLFEKHHRPDPNWKVPAPAPAPKTKKDD